MIFSESRYETSDVVPVADASGVYRATIITSRTVTAGEYSTYRVRMGDHIEALAFTAFGDAELWWQIADANPELDYPDELTPGALLRIPRAKGL